MSDPDAGGGPLDAALGEAALRVRVLGPFQIEGLDLTRLRSRKARTALKVLALGRGRPVSLGRLVDGMWPDGGEPVDPGREVAVNVSRARKLVGRDRIERTEAGYRLAVDWLDLDRLDELATEARRRQGRGDHVATRTLASAGLELVTGAVLADEPETPWLTAERISVDQTVAELRTLAAAAALEVGEWGEAAHWGELALAADPYDEAAARTVMSARLGGGRPGSALAFYAALRRRLADDLGASPGAETEALHLVLLTATEGSADPPADPGATPAGPDAAAGGSPPFPAFDHLTGRDDALARIGRAAAEVTASGALQLVVVEGEAGSGKTQVLEAVSHWIEAQGGAVLVGRCDERGRALPLQPVADALSAYLRLGGGTEGPDDLLGPDRELLGPLLGLHSSVPLPPVPAPAMSGEAMQGLIFAALARVMGAVAATRPAVLLIDDLHLAGPSTIELLRFLSRRRRDVPLLVVAARRPGPGPTLTDVVRVELEPLDLAAAAELVGADRAPGLIERSGGNALLLVELAAHPSDQVPSSIRESVAAQVAQAGPELEAIIRTAAILGPEIDLDLLAEVTGRPAVALVDELEAATERRLLAERGSRFVFRHALVREALLAQTSRARQAVVHGQAARVLDARLDADPLVVADHARQAGDRATAATALARAAELATGRHDLADAEARLDQAIDLRDSGELRLARGHVRVARSRFDEAEQDALAAAAQGWGAQALALRAWIARYRHDLITAVRLGREGADQADDPTTAASCLLAEALAQRGLGELPAADALLAQATALGAPVDLGLSGWIGVLRVHQGRVEEALDRLIPAVGAEVDTVHGFWVEHVLQMTAHATALAGRPADALALVDRLATEIERRASAVRYGGLEDNYRAWILASMGQPEAADLTASAIERAAMPEIEAQARLDDAARLARSGDRDRASQSLQAARAIAAQGLFYNQWRCVARAELIDAELALDDDPERAQAGAEAVVAHSIQRGERRYATLGRLLAARGRHRADPQAPVDLDGLAVDLDRLASVAGLDSWWLTAQVAAEFDQDRWWTLARHRAADLAAQTGDRADSFRSSAQMGLDRLAVRRRGR